MPMREAMAIAMVLVVPDVKCQSRTIRYGFCTLMVSNERARGECTNLMMREFPLGVCCRCWADTHSSCETTEGRCSTDKSQSVLTVSSYNEDISCNKSAMRIQGVKCN